MSSSAAGYATSLARQQHLPPPKVSETLSSKAVSNGAALEAMCTFLESEKAKLSHLDLQQHWTDLHGVATTLCRQEERQHEQQGGGEGDDVRRHAQLLEQMMLDVEAVRSGGYEEAHTPSGTSRHVHFPEGGHDEDNDDNAEEEDEAVGDSDNRKVEPSAPSQHNEKVGKERESKKKTKQEKKEMKKVAKREKKEAKKRLKKESRKSAKR